MLQSSPLAIPGVLRLLPSTLMDSQGWQTTLYSEASFAAAGIHDRFVQDTIFYADKPGSLRGLHYQLPPAAQALLIRVLRGSAMVAVADLRRSSQTFGRAVTADLSYMAGDQLYVMPGFAFGWCSREPATEILVKASAPHHADLLRGINARDPKLAIAWPLKGGDLQFAPGDIDQPMLAEQPDLYD
jgi:dTDP-4-dehydrorhamnose 3,5-epimerase